LRDVDPPEVAADAAEAARRALDAYRMLGPADANPHDRPADG
jgi:hypothetical protein